MQLTSTLIKNNMTAIFLQHTKLSVLGLSTLVLLSACGGGNNPKEKLDALKKQQAELITEIRKLEQEIALTDTTQKEKVKTVEATAIAVQPFAHYIEVQAKVDGDEDVNVSATTQGIVTEVLVKAGDHVSKGQILATLDDKLMQQGVAEVQSQLDLATTVYNRQKNLWDQKIGSEVQYLTAKTNKEALEKRLGTMREQWNMTRVKSPIDGTVDNVAIKIGQAVMPGLPCVRVVNLSSLKVKGELPESYIAKVKKGNDAIVYFPDQNKELKTKVDYSGNAISTLNRTFNVEIKLNDKSGTIKPNMIAVLKIADYQSASAFVLPVGAVLKGTEGEYVFVAESENGKTITKRKAVKSGIIYNGLTEITEGLKEGDKVITAGYQNLVEGDIVKI